MRGHGFIKAATIISNRQGSARHLRRKQEKLNGRIREDRKVKHPTFEAAIGAGTSPSLSNDNEPNPKPGS